MSNSPKATMSHEEMVALFKQDLKTGVGKSVKHDSAALQVTGEAKYIDDKLEFPNQLHTYALLSPHAHANILSIDLSPCYEFEGVAIAITSQDIPGNLDIGAILPGDPLLADGKVEYVGQPVIAVAANDLEVARKAAHAAVIEYEILPAVLDVEEALEKKLFVTDTHQQKRGDSKTAIAHSKHVLEGSLHVGGQEHFYLETQIATVMPTEDGGMIVHSSTQNPTEIQKLVAGVLGIPMHKVLIDVRRMGGGFGGKETQSSYPACMASVIAKLTNRPTKMRLFRTEDMMMTGKRHPFYNQYKVGFDDQGTITGIEIDVAGNCGYSPDLSSSIVDRAMFHSDNAYYLGEATVTGYRCKTNTASNTAFRGFGGPQGMMTIEHIMDDIAAYLNKDALEVRQANYYGKRERNVTHYFQTVEDSDFMPEITEQLIDTSDYYQRREEINEFNKQSPILKKGLAITPVKFGISFTASFLNQAGALIHIYTDGSIHLNHGGTEMGQGLNTKVAQIVAEEFQVDISRIQITATNTEKVPNTSPTAASSGTDLNGKAAQNAARHIKVRLVNFASEHFKVAPEDVQFKNGIIQAGKTLIEFDEFIQLAYFNQVSLSSTGFYRTPKIYYDHEKAKGRPFYYFAYGASCSEVIVDTLTGEYKILRADLLHDVGASLNPAIDIGQVEGAFVQGAGWLTTEELVWNDEGRLTTNGPASYKIPAVADMPIDFRTHLLQNRQNPEDTVFHSKAVGEPPFMLAMSVWSALKDAIRYVIVENDVSENVRPHLDTPATPERVLMAIEKVRESAKTSSKKTA
ncbi:xanthine dehydrogenase molybdopterin binding subunit [Vibrio penaeicida]|uniref:Xanthine dehydrogenase molybdopterin binding subunit n=1 Tax=Vibrio penaeicida TaxID=104609 RepID=A0AAV5NV43_9VIBR|nr:xanthine dehydrogenase molybdopterin binding subunit [Vibrio penaeicida]RTZ22314.1 xanthine dehydrogenase molybdopterin binding subunit [Vibrio penaeicida]GLQ74149.1 xanthine dehydrogenase molybdopterin binding subunit [Vibrio penaeicida]